MPCTKDNVSTVALLSAFCSSILAHIPSTVCQFDGKNEAASSTYITGAGLIVSIVVWLTTQCGSKDGYAPLAQDGRTKSATECRCYAAFFGFVGMIITAAGVAYGFIEGCKTCD